MSTPMSAERAPVGDLVRELLSRISELLNTQIKLVKTEIKVESRKMVTAVAYGIAAAVIGIFFILFLGVSLILLLSTVLETHWAALITTGLFLTVTAFFAWLAMREVHKNSATIDIEI